MEGLCPCGHEPTGSIVPVSSFAHSPSFSLLHLRHSSFSKPSVASPTSQFILQAFFWFSYEQSSFSKLFVASPTSQLILQPFPRFTYVTDHSPTTVRFSYDTGFSLTSPGEPPMLCSSWEKVHYLSIILTLAGLGCPEPLNMEISKFYKTQF